MLVDASASSRSFAAAALWRDTLDCLQARRRADSRAHNKQRENSRRWSTDPTLSGSVRAVKCCTCRRHDRIGRIAALVSAHGYLPTMRELFEEPFQFSRKSGARPIGRVGLRCGRMRRPVPIRRRTRILVLVDLGRSRCLVPSSDGAFLSPDWKDALWDKFYTAAPRRLRQSVEQYKIVKRA